MQLSVEHLPLWVLLSVGGAYILGVIVLVVASARMAIRVLRVVGSATHHDRIMAIGHLHRREARALLWPDPDFRALVAAVAVIGVTHLALLALGHAFAPG